MILTYVFVLNRICEALVGVVFVLNLACLYCSDQIFFFNTQPLELHGYMCMRRYHEVRMRDGMILKRLTITKRH